MSILEPGVGAGVLGPGRAPLRGQTFRDVPDAAVIGVTRGTEGSIHSSHRI